MKNKEQIAGVTFSLSTGVYVTVAGKSGADGGLVAQLSDWLLRSNILPRPQTSRAFRGGYEGFFSPDDAEKIRVWLEEQGVAEDAS